ncbi:luciferase [Frondihabitans sucicola]|uniref:Luciferase n=1 Tax=Frondihabitans sucicola TaxID=1268041 RepID=A0ABM8GS68_9MICO|nr:LLM class flavin-dependent oxidoreductase [Frondihabitans sucicola]BDZ51315.1 luciferase [Frondihabitans sucicola]
MTIPTTAPSLAVFSHVTEAPPARDSYRSTLDLFAAAESLGYEDTWIRQFHLRSDDDPSRGGLPSPFVFLAAVAEHTSTIRLGTGVVVLPLESPVRVAEDAAVLDALSGGRLQLGLANGGGAPGLTDLFAPKRSNDDVQDRKTAYLDDVRHLKDALDGHELLPDGQRLNPAAPGLTDRIWEATLSEQSGFDAATRGHGVLLGTTQTIPAEVTAAAYYRGLPAGVAPRVGIATAIYPAKDRETALREARDGIEAKYAWGESFLPKATTLAEKAASLNLHYGTADDIAESILSKPYSRFATQLLVQVEHGYADFGLRREALALFASDVAPQLGWHAPARTQGVPA